MKTMKPISNIANRLFYHTSPSSETSEFSASEDKNSLPTREETLRTSRAFCAIDCPGRCPLVLQLRDGELAGVRADKVAPACHRGLSMRAWASSPDRLMWPMRRVGPRGSAQFERVTWDEALDTVASELARIQREYGNEAINLAYSTGQSCTTADPFERLLNCFGGFLDRYNNYSNPQINAMVRSMYGEGALYPGGSDLDVAADAQLVLVFGASPAETGTGRATWHGAWDRMVAHMAERGGRIVMVDPRRNGSLREAEHAFARAASPFPTVHSGEDGADIAPSPDRQDASKSSSLTSGLPVSHSICKQGHTSNQTVAASKNLSDMPQVSNQPSISWLPINPGTDGALVAALLYELAFAHNALDWDFLHERCIGFTDDTLLERWRGKGLSAIDYLQGTSYDHVAKTPAWAGRITGVSEATIRDLARELAHARPAFIMQGWGPQRRSNGEMTSGMIMLLALALGQVGLPGTNNGMNVAWGGGFLTHVSAGHNSVPFRIPAYRFLDAIECGPRLGAPEGVRGLAEEQHLPSSIKAIVCHGGNCLTNQHGDINRAHRVLADPAKCEFIVNIDVEFTDSARYADIVLPDLFRMEQVSVMDADTWGRRIVASDGALSTRFERRGAWDMCRDLAKRWGIESAFTEELTEREWICKLYEADCERSNESNAAGSLPPFDQLLDRGVCFREDVRKPFVALADWRRDPAAHPLDTPSGKVEIFSEHLAAVAESLRDTPDEGAITPIPTYVPEWSPAEFGIIESHKACGQPLRVFGFHSIARIHSSWGNVFAMPQRPRQVISINPTDARARGIQTGDLVEAANKFGTLRLPAKVTDDVIAGTIIMPQGAWWKGESRSNECAGQPSSESNDEPSPIDIGGCINTLTSSRPSPLAFGNPQHTCWCRVARA